MYILGILLALCILVLNSSSIDCIIQACDNDVELTKSIVQETYGEGVRFFVYEKCNDNAKDAIILPNVGREQHTYALHVSKHYNNLADVLVFTPSNIDKHPLRKRTIRESHNADFSCNYTGGTFGSHVGWKHPDSYEGRRLDHASPRGVKSWAEEHIGCYGEDDKPTCKWGTFVTTRSNIHKTPRHIFENIAKELEVPEPEAGHYMERVVEILYGAGCA